jgi:hypothetical protein
VVSTCLCTKYSLSLCITYGCYERAAAISVFVSALVIWFQGLSARGHISFCSLFCFTSSRERASGHSQSEPLKQRQMKVAFNSWTRAAENNLSPYNSSISLAAMEATCMHTVFSCTNTEIVGSNPTWGKDACLRIFCAVLYRTYRKSAYLLRCLVQYVYVSSVLSCTVCLFCAVLYSMSAYLLCCLVQHVCVSSVLSCIVCLRIFCAVLYRTYRKSEYLLCSYTACLRIFCALLYSMSAYLLCCLVQDICVSSVMSCTGCLRTGRSPVQGIYHFYEGLIFSEVNC